MYSAPSLHTLIPPTSAPQKTGTMPLVAPIHPPPPDLNHTPWSCFVAGRARTHRLPCGFIDGGISEEADKVEGVGDMTNEVGRKGLRGRAGVCVGGGGGGGVGCCWRMPVGSLVFPIRK
jgi:hypothetical protein